MKPKQKNKKEQKTKPKKDVSDSDEEDDSGHEDEDDDGSEVGEDSDDEPTSKKKAGEKYKVLQLYFPQSKLLYLFHFIAMNITIF